jgi:uncharacterized phage infection (PIP) family protein YhgE
MEKADRPSFLKSLALAFGDGILFGVAMKLAQGPSKSREEEMTELDPLAERLRKVEDHAQTIDKDGLTKFGEGLDGRVLEKVIVALEARLTEHVGQVDRRLAEIDAQVALDLKAVDTHTAAQTGAVEKAIQQIEAQVRDYVAAAQQSNADQVSGVDQKLTALQEALPAKFREIVEAVRQSMEARIALELTELENRVASRGVTLESVQEIQSHLRGEVEALADRLATQMRGLAEHHESQTVPLQQGLQQLETKLNNLREDLPPKIRQIVEAVEASMDARISSGDQQAADRAAALEQALAALRAEMPSACGFQQAVDEKLRRHAEQVGALDEKLTVLQEELPPKIKAIVDAVRGSLDARMAVELQSLEERHSLQMREAAARASEAQQQLRQQLAAESKTPELEQNLAKLQAEVAAMLAQIRTNDRQAADRLSGVEQHAAQISAGVSAELESLRAQHAAQIEQLEGRWRAERAAEDVPTQINSAIAGLRESMEANLAAKIHDLETRTPDRTPELDKALQYASLLEARVQALEQKLQRSAEETVDRAVERVWQALEARLQREAHAPSAVAQPPETITGLRQKSTNAEQSVTDLIAGIGQLFEKPGQRILRETPPETVAPVAQTPAAPEPVATIDVPSVPEPKSETQPEPEPEMPVVAETPAEAPMAASTAVEEFAEPKLDDKPPVILFKPKESGRKWRIPFVSTFLMMAAAVAWLQFM